MPELFQFGNFTLASGRQSRLKIECDAVSLNEWHMLARLSLRLVPAFHAVCGVPTGGYKWEDIFRHYVDPNAHLFLFVDDVWTTGQSMRNYVAEVEGALATTITWHGLVLFARGPVPENVTVLFHAHKDLE